MFLGQDRPRLLYFFNWLRSSFLADVLGFHSCLGIAAVASPAVVHILPGRLRHPLAPALAACMGIALRFCWVVLRAPLALISLMPFRAWHPHAPVDAAIWSVTIAPASVAPCALRGRCNARALPHILQRSGRYPLAPIWGARRTCILCCRHIPPTFRHVLLRGRRHILAPIRGPCDSVRGQQKKHCHEGCHSKSHFWACNCLLEPKFLNTSPVRSSRKWSRVYPAAHQH